MNPVQTYYLGTYTVCFLLSGDPEAMTTVRYAEKTAPGLTPETLLPEDAVKGTGPKHPLALSPKAAAEGWRAVAIASPGKVRAKELQAYLQTTVYDGDSPWAIFLRPICYALAGVVFLYALWFQFGRRSRFPRNQEQRHGRRTKGPELLSRLHGSSDGGIRFLMEREGIFGKWLPASSFHIPRRLEASHILLMGDTGSGKSSANLRDRRVVHRAQTLGLSDLFCRLPRKDAAIACGMARPVYPAHDGLLRRPGSEAGLVCDR